MVDGKKVFFTFFFYLLFLSFIHCQTKRKKWRIYANFHLSSFSFFFHFSWPEKTFHRRKKFSTEKLIHLNIRNKSTKRCTCRLFIHILCEKNSKNLCCRKRSRDDRGWNETVLLLPNEAGGLLESLRTKQQSN